MLKEMEMLHAFGNEKGLPRCPICLDRANLNVRLLFMSCITTKKREREEYKLIYIWFIVNVYLVLYITDRVNATNWKRIFLL